MRANVFSFIETQSPEISGPDAACAVEKGDFSTSVEMTARDGKGSASIVFFLWKKVALLAQDDSRLFVEKPKPCGGLAWLIFHHKISWLTTSIKKPSFIKKGGDFSI